MHSNSGENISIEWKTMLTAEFSSDEELAAEQSLVKINGVN